MRRHHAAAALCAAAILAGCSDIADPAAPADRGPSAGSRAGDARPPRVPGRPVAISARRVEAELRDLRRKGHFGAHDAPHLIRSLDQAVTSRGLNHTMGAVLAALHGRRGQEARRLRQIAFRNYNRLAPGVRPSVTFGYEGPGACDLDFDDPDALNAMFEAAQSTFTSPPHYVLPCGEGELRVEPVVRDHYHVLYEDVTIDCYDDEGRMGRGEFGDCVALDDPAQEPRYMAGHDGAEVIRIRLRNGGTSLPFTVHSFANVDASPVKFRYLTSDGVWFQWNSLAGGWIWDVSAYVIDVVEVQILHAGTSLSCGPNWLTASPPNCPVAPVPIFVDDFSISP